MHSPILLQPSGESGWCESSASRRPLALGARSSASCATVPLAANTPGNLWHCWDLPLLHRRLHGLYLAPGWPVASRNTPSFAPKLFPSPACHLVTCIRTIWASAVSPHKAIDSPLIKSFIFFIYVLAFPHTLIPLLLHCTWDSRPFISWHPDSTIDTTLDHPGYKQSRWGQDINCLVLHLTYPPEISGPGLSCSFLFLSTHTLRQCLSSQVLLQSGQGSVFR